MPYTEEFMQSRHRFNLQAAQQLNDREFWLQLKYVMKYGVHNINQYLAQHGGGGASAAGS